METLQYQPEIWRLDAECERLGVPTRVFFSDHIGDISQAKRICTQCSVLVPCLEGAIDRRETWGVWGGQIFRNGKMLSTKRRRGRPSKIPRVEEQMPTVPVPVHLQRYLRSA